MALRPLPRHPQDLESEDDLRYQGHAWRLQWVGTLSLVVLLLAALGGAFGSGPLSHGVRELPGVMRVEYQRLSRYETSEALTIHLNGAVTRAGEVRLWLDRQYLDRARVESVVPEPARVEGGAAGRLVYAFPMARPGEPLTVTFRLQPEQLGIAHAGLGVETASDRPSSLTFRQLVWP